MTENHPITPPPELVQQWVSRTCATEFPLLGLAEIAAQWGADQELEACYEWLRAKYWICPDFTDELRAARRPKPPSLKEQALEALAHILNNSSTQLGADTIRRALEQLDD
jgi:hypothetical protein